MAELLGKDRGRVPDLPARETEGREDPLIDLRGAEARLDGGEGLPEGFPEERPGRDLQRPEPGLTGPHEGDPTGQSRLPRPVKTNSPALFPSRALPFRWLDP